MIIGFHLIWTTYGHWFPNDPRGSWSREVWRPCLAELRPVDAQRNTVKSASIEAAELQSFFDQARPRLKWSAVQLTVSEVAIIGETFGEIAAKTDLSVWACAILPDHVHLVIERHGLSYERIVDKLKGQTAQRIRESRGYPAAADRADRIPIWTQGYWVRYIDSSAGMVQVIAYVNANLPESAPQEWSFVK